MTETPYTVRIERGTQVFESPTIYTTAPDHLTDWDAVIRIGYRCLRMRRSFLRDDIQICRVYDGMTYRPVRKSLSAGDVTLRHLV